MGVFSDITGAISGAGSIAGAVSAVAKVVGQALGMAHDKEQRNEGATAQDDATKTSTLETVVRVNAPIDTAERDKLWDANKKRFGVIDGSSGKTG